MLVKTPTGRLIGHLSEAAAKRWDNRRLATITKLAEVCRTAFLGVGYSERFLCQQST